ncbi:MAG: T9SS type A sorting domain-containing protein [Thermotogae bacterium]|nr:T9SS type A sorting domain-containing protein [Thermotogota bacterium]
MFWVGAYTVSFGEAELNSLMKYSPSVGYPEVPVKVVALELAPDEYVREVRVKGLTRRAIDYSLTYTQVIDTPGGNYRPIRITPERYPQRVAWVGNQGFLRGRNLAFIVVSAITLEDGQTYLNETVEFDIVKGHRRISYDVPAGSHLPVWRKIFSALGLAEPREYVPHGGIDYVIITTEDLRDAWEPLAQLRNSMGIRTEIFTVEWIGSNFPGKTLQERIRNFLRYAYRTWGITYVLIGASAEDVPPLRTYLQSFSDTTYNFYGRYFQNFELTDYYYAALDGDWNPSSDAWEGDMEGAWDRFIDLIPDVIVSRYPAVSPQDVRTYVSHVYEYETATSFDEPRFLFMASSLFGDTLDPDSADGCLITYDLGDKVSFGDTRYLCERPPTEIRDSINTFGPTFIFGVGHSNHRLIMTQNTGSAYSAFDYWRVEQLSPPRMSISGWIGCFINDPYDNSVGLEMVRRGKSIASIGAAKADYSITAPMFWEVLVDSLAASPGFPILGDMVYTARFGIAIMSQFSILYRHLLFTYNIIGDPLLRVFNRPRRAVEAYVWATDSTLEFRVMDSTTLAPLQFARLGATDGRVAFGPAYTDASGRGSIRMPGGRMLWGVWYPTSLIRVGTLNVSTTRYRLVVDSASISSASDTATLSVWISNRGGANAVGILPFITSTGFYVLSSPGARDIPAGGTTRYDWVIVRSPYLSSPTLEVRLFAPSLVDTFYVSWAYPKLNFISATWHTHYDTVFIFFDVANAGTDTAYDVRVVPDSTSLGVLHVGRYDTLPPSATTAYSLGVRLVGVPYDGERIRFRLYGGAVMYDTFSIVLRRSIPLPTLRDYWHEPGQGEDILRWHYFIADTMDVKITWKVRSGDRTLNTEPLNGSFFSLRSAPLRRESVVVYSVIDGVEGPPLFTTVMAPQPELLSLSYVELLRFSSAPVYTKNSHPVMAQLLNYTAEPEIVVATTYNRIVAMSYDARRIIWDTYTDGWMETPPVVADINDDGIYEVVFATTYSIYALHGYDGSIVWQVPIPTFPGMADSFPHPFFLMATKPFADSTPYILMVSRNGSAFLFNGRGEMVAYRLDSVAAYDIRDTVRVSPPATYDFDGDGNWEVVYKVRDSLWVFGGNLTPKPGFPVYVPALTTGLFIYDMDGDSAMEIFLCGHRNFMYESDGTQRLYDDNAYYPNYRCLPLDYDGDGRADVAFYSPVYTKVGIWAVQDTGLVPLFTTSQTLGTRVKFGISADVDGDGRDEFLLSDSRSKLHAHSYGWDLYDLPGFPIDLSDGNGFRSSMVISPAAYSYDGHLYIYGPTEANLLYVWRTNGREVWGNKFANRWATSSPAVSLPDEVPVSVAEVRSPERPLRFRLEGRRLTLTGRGAVKARLYDVAGRLIARGEGDENLTLDLGHLPKGVYMLMASDSRERRVFKVILR